jgi:AAHS family 4-hydroxybenzoate transporter-like MFS transporter
MKRAVAESLDVVDVTAVIDRNPVGRLQWTTFALCLFCLIMDGFDVQALGYTAPSIVRQWGVAPAVLGSVFAAANFGVLIGAFLCSMLADRVGRRPVIIGATVFFGVMTLLTTQATTIQELLVFRLIAGIGMGTIIPNASALVSEYMPQRLRPTMVMIVGVGFTAGAAVGGFIANALIPRYGWQSVFVLGGIVPLVIAAAMAVALPESLQLMVLRRKSRAQLSRWINRIDPGLVDDGTVQFTVREENKTGVPVLHLFREGRGAATVLIWIINFMNLLNLYALSNWLAIVVTNMGYASQAVLVSTTLQVGGTIGTFGLAWLVARKGFVTVMAITFALAAASIATVGQNGLSLAAIFVAVFVAGWCVVGSQPGLNALSAAYYPTYVRSTGVGAGLGVGRIGAILGPIVGAQFIANGWTTQAMVLAAAVPAAISAISMVLLKSVVGAKLGVTKA